MRMWECGSVGVGEWIWNCGNVGVWGYGSMEIWECGSMKVWAVLLDNVVLKITTINYGNNTTSLLLTTKDAIPTMILLYIFTYCYIPHQELQGTPQEVKHQTPSDLPTNISLFHVLYYLIWSSHLCCCSHYYIPVHHCILLTYLEQVEPCLVFY